jgi:hypothetical protein
MFVILASQEVEIMRSTAQSQPGQMVCETLSRKIPSLKRAGGWLKVKGLSSNPSTAKKKKTQNQKTTNKQTKTPKCKENEIP